MSKKKKTKRVSLKKQPKRRVTLHTHKPPSPDTVKALKEKLSQLEDEIEELRPKRNPGRPTKLNNKNQREVLLVLRLGLSYATAAKRIRVSESTLRKWRDEDDLFSAACQKAEADAAISNTTELQAKINSGNLTALIFWMKCRTAEFREKRYEIFQDAGEFDPSEEFL